MPSAAIFSRFGVRPAGRAVEGATPSMSTEVLDHPCASAWMKTKLGRAAFSPGARAPSAATGGAGAFGAAGAACMPRTHITSSITIRISSILLDHEAIRIVMAFMHELPRVDR